MTRHPGEGRGNSKKKGGSSAILPIRVWEARRIGGRLAEGGSPGVGGKGG